MIGKFVASLMLLFALTPAYCAEANSPLEEKFDKQIQGYVDQERFQGVVLIARDGGVLFKSAYGLADISNEVPNTPAKQFLIGSLTKSFTAVAVMRLADQKKVDLHAPVSKYIPKLESRLADGLTLHILMKHQSGLPVHLERLASFENKDVTSDEILEIINTSNRSFSPGSQYQYSNLNYHLAAIAIENVTGMSYAQALQQLIFDPLEMTGSGVERIAYGPADRAKGYRKGLVGLTQDENIVSYALGSGDIYSTVEDLWKWEQSLYGTQLLTKESVERLFTAENTDFGNYGYGFRIQEYQRGAEAEGTGILTRHGGSMDGFLANLHRYTDDRLTVIVLGNVRPFPIRDLTFELKEIALGMDSLRRNRASME